MTTEQESSVTASLEWNAPGGTGPGYFIDYYEISVASEFRSHQYFNSVYTSLDIALSYNEMYGLSIVSVNCAGRSKAVFLHNVRFGKYVHKHKCCIIRMSSGLVPRLSGRRRGKKNESLVYTASLMLQFFTTMTNFDSR